MLCVVLYACAVLRCSLLCGCCSVFGAGGSVQVNTRRYPCRFTGTRLPYSTKNPTNTRGFWSHARILPGIGLVFWFSIDGSQLYSTQHTHSTQHHQQQQQGIAHHTSHMTHSTPEWVCVVRPPRRLEGGGNNAASSGETLRYIVIHRLRYISRYRQNPSADR